VEKDAIRRQRAWIARPFMQTHSKPQALPKDPSAAGAPRIDASIRDSVRILAEIITQLAERIELLEARETLRAAT